MDEWDFVADALTMQTSFVALMFQMQNFYVLLLVHSVLNIACNEMQCRHHATNTVLLVIAN